MMPPLAIVALSSNILLAVGAFFLFPSEFAETTSRCFMSGQFFSVAGQSHFLAPVGCAETHCYVAALIGSGAAVSTVIAFARRRIGPGPALVALIIHAAALLLLFAGIYLGFGLEQGGAEVKDLGWANALYFSVVTWTTLGYGDFVPRAAIRLVAALQALLGYVFFGLIVGLLADYLKSEENRGG